jgi:hypothetical protein
MHGHRQAIANLAKNAADSYARGMKKALEEAPAKKPAKTKEADRRNDAGWIFVLPALLRPCLHDLAHRLSAINGRRACPDVAKVPTQPVPAGLAE